MEIITNFQIDPVDIWAYTENTGEEVTKRGIEFFNRTRPFINNMTYDSKPDIPTELGIFHPHVDSRFVIDFTDGSFDLEKAVDVAYVKTQRGVAYKMIVLSEGTLWIYMMGQRPKVILSDIIKDLLQRFNIEFEIVNSDYIFKTGEKFSIYSIYANMQGYYYENYVLTFSYEDAFFKKALPGVFYSRSYIENSAGISGLLTKYPTFDINDFIGNLINEANNL